MHIAEGVLAAPVLGTGAVLAAAGCGIGIKKIDYQSMPRVAVLSSVFFVASLIHIPVGPTSAHLILNGLAGIILGWASFPALLLALFLQAVLFQFGGFTTLGVNTVTMALPALLCYFAAARLLTRRNSTVVFVTGFMIGFVSILFSALLVALALYFSSGAFVPVSKMIIIVHLPVMIIEGILTGFVVLFLKRVKPELLVRAK